MTFQRFIFATDLHGDMADADTCAALLRFKKEFDPHVTIFGGDAFDFRGLRKGAAAAEQAESMRSDVDAGLRFLESFRPNYFLRGNHDERLWELAQYGQGITADYAQHGVKDITDKCAAMKCKILPYDKRKGVLKIGNVNFLHGFHCGVTATRMHALAYNECVHGHTHTIDVARVAGIDRRTARSVGCLCRLDMPYNSRMPSSLRHAHGWAYGLIDSKTGAAQIFQAEKFGDKSEWLLPTKLQKF